MRVRLQAELPSAPEVERSVLGTILLMGTKAYIEYAQRVRPEHFKLDSHRRIYGRMADLAESGGEIDFLTLHDALSRNGELQTVGGEAQLSGLTDHAIAYVQQSHIEILLDRYRRRELIHACDAAATRAYDLSEPTVDCY